MDVEMFRIEFTKAILIAKPTLLGKDTEAEDALAMYKKVSAVFSEDHILSTRTSALPTNTSMGATLSSRRKKQSNL